MKKIRVCMYTGNFPPEFSGAAIQCQTLMKNIRQNNTVEFTVVTITRNKNLRKEESIDGFDIHRILRKDSYFLQKVFFFLKVLFTLCKVRDKFDILHIHGFSWYPILVAKLLRKKTVLKMTMVGDDDPITIRKQSLGRAKFYLFSKADMVISTSLAFTERCREALLPQSKLEKIPNGVDIDRFQPIGDPSEKKRLRKQLSLPTDARIVTFIGVLCKRKGVDLLIEAWECARSKRKMDAQLLLIGPKNPGELKEIQVQFIRDIESKVDSRGLQDEVIFLGETDEVEQYLRASDIFVLPSEKEGLPNTLLEAMACGLPCVASRIEGITDRVIDNDVNGLLVEQGDVHGLAEAILRLLKDEDFGNALGNNALKQIVQNYSIEKIAQRYVSIYKSCLADKK